MAPVGLRVGRRFRVPPVPSPPTTPSAASSGLPTIGVVHPGAMGVTVASAARSTGHRVLWASAGRSAATAQRARHAAIEDAGTLVELATRSDVVLSVCPPDAATAMAGAIAQVGFRGIFVDANAISPATLAVVADLAHRGGADVVDGGIVGPPAHQPGTTRLYLSGARASEVAAVFGGTDLEAVDLGERLGAASALKVCYAAYTKGTAALLLAVVALSRETGVEQPLMVEWDRSQPGLRARAGSTAAGSAPKAWRWTGEMAEIASTFDHADLPSGFHRAAGEVFERLSVFRDGDADLHAVVEALLGESAEVRPPGG